MVIRPRHVCASTLILVWFWCIVRHVDPRPNYNTTTYDSTEPNPRSLLPPRLGSGASAQNNTLHPDPVVRGSTQFGEDLRASTMSWTLPPPLGVAPLTRQILTSSSSAYLGSRESAPTQIDGYAGLDPSMARGRPVTLTDPSTSSSLSILHNSVSLMTDFGEGSGTRAYLGWRPDFAATATTSSSGHAPTDWLNIRTTRGRLLHTLFENTQIQHGYKRHSLHWMLEDSAAFNAAYNLSLADVGDSSRSSYMQSLLVNDSGDMMWKRLIRKVKHDPYSSSFFVPGRLSYALFSRSFVALPNSASNESFSFDGQEPWR